MAQRKRYKTLLDPGYSGNKASPDTHAAWKRRCKGILQRIDKASDFDDSIQHDDSSCPDAADDSDETDFLEKENSVYSSTDEDLDVKTDEDIIHHENGPDKDDGITSIPDVSTNDFTQIPRSCSAKESMPHRVPPDTGSRIMFEASSLTVNDVISMVAGYSLRFGISNEARLGLINLLKVCAGPSFEGLKISSHAFSKNFLPPDDKTQFHYYCTTCHVELYSTEKQNFSAQNVTCDVCNKAYEVNLSSDNFFLSIDLRYQISQLMKNNRIRTALVDKLNMMKVRNQDSCINDIDDGELQHRIAVTSPYNTTYNFSTDGAPLFHKSKRSFWPLQIILNGLPPEMRFKYVLLAGIMVVKREPAPALMQLFLTPFVEQVNQLRLKGIDLGLRNDGQPISCTFTPLCCSVDSVARAVLQNRLQFNGYFGCSYCYQRGEFFASAMRYPFEENEPELRTHDSHMQDVLQFDLSRSLLKSRGVKGASILSTIQNFDMVWSFPLDQLHTPLIGTGKHLWKLLAFTPTDSWFRLSLAQKKIVDKRLRNVRPIREIHNLPRGLADESNWKAKDWRAWLLFYSIPICLDLIPKDVLEHYSLFVICIYTLSQSKITDTELDKCEEKLMRFVALFQCHYGVQSMRFNVHSLLHAVQSVRQSGPLWATSTFPFEGNIFVLKQLVNGPKGVEQQIAKKSLNVLQYKVGLFGDSSTVNEAATIYCESLFSRKRSTQSALVENGVTFFGRGNYSTVNGTNRLAFNKCIYKGHVYLTVNYSRCKKWNDSVVKLKSGKIAQINEIIRMPDGRCCCDISYLSHQDVFVGEIKLPHIWRVISVNDDRSLVSIDDVYLKVMVINVETEQYVCMLPNFFEAD